MRPNMDGAFASGDPPATEVGITFKEPIKPCRESIAIQSRATLHMPLACERVRYDPTV